MAQATTTTDAEIDALREKLVRAAVDDFLRMTMPPRRSFLGGFLAAVGMGGFAVGDGLPHGGVVKPFAKGGALGAGSFGILGEHGPEMILPLHLARKIKLGVKDGWQTAEGVGPITITVHG